MDQTPAEIRRLVGAAEPLVGPLLDLNHLPDNDYLDGLARWLRSATGAAKICIGTLHGGRGETLTLLAAAGDPALSLGPRGLADSACGDVVAHGLTWRIDSRVRERYPDDQLLAHTDADGYIGCPIVDTDGTTVGVIAALTRANQCDHEALVRCLEWIAPSLARALAAGAREPFDALLREWARPLGRAPAEDDLVGLTDRLSRALNVTTVAVVAWQPDGAVVKLLRHRGQILLRGAPCNLDDAPCAALRAERTRYLPDRVQERFPRAQIASLVNARGYFGVRIDDDAGRPIGHLALYHTRPLAPLRQARRDAVDVCARLLAPLLTALDQRRGGAPRAAADDGGALAGSIAHDFNNLLVGILGNVSLALDALPGESAAADSVRRIERSAARVGELVMSMLRRTGQAPSPRRVVAPATLLRQLAADARTDADLEPGLPRVLADPVRLDTVLRALVEVPPPGADHVKLAAGAVHLDRERLRALELGHYLTPGRFVALRVSYRGADPAGLEAVLSADSHPATADARAFAHGHDGGLEVAATADGAQVTLYLPPTRQPGSVPARDDTLTQQVAAVAVVDDEDAVREVTGALLEAVGLRVARFVNGAEFVAAAAHTRFDAAFLDIRMPGLDGWATLERVRRIQPDLPVVMMSGFTEYDAAQKLAERNDTTFLNKPFGREALLEHLQRALTVRPVAAAETS